MIQAPDRIAVASDADLVLAVRAGQPGAFDVLYARHWPRVVGVCARRVPASDVEDAAQDVFLRALHRLDTLDDPARFGPWVRTIAVRACADALRGRPAVTVGDLPEVVDTTDPTHDDVIVAREDARQLASGLATLQPRDSHALWLRDALETPVGDIARDLGMTEASTRVMLARARQRLRAAMGAVAAWVAGIVGIRRQWLSGLFPAHPPAIVAAHAAAAIAAIALVVPLFPDTPLQDQPATPDRTMTTTADPAPAAAPAPAADPHDDEPAASVPPVAPPAEAPQPAATREATPPVSNPVVTVERQPMNDPDDDRAAQMGDNDGEFLVDVYDGGVVGEVVDNIVPGCLGTC